MNTRHIMVLIAPIAFALILFPITSVAWGQVEAVSNLSEPSGGNSFNTVGAPFAQSFTTGDAPRTLSSISVAAQSNMTGSSGMMLRSEFRNGPGDLVEDLGTQSIPVGESLPVFTSTGTVLEANTTYWVTLGEGGSGNIDFRWLSTESAGQTSPIGWTLGDEVLTNLNGGIRWETVDSGDVDSGRISFQVEELPGPMTFSYSGIVDGMASGGFPDPDSFRAFGGQPIEVTFTFDPNTTDTNASANGDYPGAVTDLEVTVGDNVYTDIDGGSIIITNNDVNPDQFQVFSFVTGPEVGGITERIQLRMIFSDSTHAVFSTDALPTIKPDPADFNLGGQINLQFTDVNDFDSSGNIITNDVSCGGVADPVTVSYSGIVDMSTGLRDMEAPFVAFDGQTIEVTFTFNPNGRDADLSANTGSYSAISNLEVTVGGNVYTDINGGNIFILNDDVNSDQFLVSSFVTGPAVGGVGGGGADNIQLRMTFSDSTNTVFSTDALPIFKPDPADFDLVRQIDLRFRGPGLGDTGGPTGGNIIATDVSCDGDFGSNILLTRNQTAPSIDFGPLSFGLAELPEEADYTVVLKRKTSNGATMYGLEDVVSANFVIGDGEFTQLESFSMLLEADGSLETMNATFAAINTTSVTDGVITMNSLAFITGTDTASGLDFAYQYGQSTDTVEIDALLGDVNRDGAVDFDDISPFIVRLSTGTFQLEADVDEDGAVDFSDISPFINILSRG
ncbi:hypothetical protein N9Y42_05225 [Mariniblastus sp.]|nr:hypothetical protein [Mariniblastus sp.]